MLEAVTALKKISRRKYVLMTGNATTSLYLALKSLNLKPKSNIMIPNISCHHVPLSIFLAGHKPVLVDIDKSNFGLNLTNIKKKYNFKIKVILAIHSFGKICKIKQIENFCKKKKIHLIEDSALSIGMKSGNKPVGSFGISSVFSFGKGKVLDASGGGALLTDDYSFFKKAERLSKKLKSKSYKFKRKIDSIDENHTKIYNNFFIKNKKSKIKNEYKKKILSKAKFFLTKFDDKILKKLNITNDRIIRIKEKRKKNFDYLNMNLNKIKKNFFSLPEKLKENEIPWRYNIFFKKESYRNHILKQLLKKKLKISSWHPRLDLFYNSNNSIYPVSEYFGNRVLNIWINDEINKTYLNKIVKIISKEKLQLKLS